MIESKKFKSAIISKNIVIFFLNCFVKSWEDDLFEQFSAMWTKSSREQTFVDFMESQFLNFKRSPLITFHLNAIFSRTTYDKLEMKWVEKYCIKNNLFKNILKQRKENINLIILIMGFNILFYNILPFSHMKFLKLKKKRYYFLKLLIDYTTLSTKDKKKFYPELYWDLEHLKKHIFSSSLKKTINYKQQYFNSTFKECKPLFPLISKTFNRNVMPKTYIDTEYDYFEEMHTELYPDAFAEIVKKNLYSEDDELHYLFKDVMYNTREKQPKSK